MHRHSIMALAVVLALGFTPVQDAADSPRETPLHTTMEGMKSHLKSLAGALQSSKSEPALEHLAALQELVLGAKLLAPANQSEQPEDMRAAHKSAYRKDLIAVLRELLEMEELVLDGKHDLALAKVISPLYPMRTEAHEKYKKAEDD